MRNTTHPTKFAQQIARGMTPPEIAAFYATSCYDGATLGKACQSLADMLKPCHHNLPKHTRLMAVVEELIG